MSRLSRNSVALIKGKKNLKQDNNRSDATALLNELSHIAQSIIRNTKAPFSKWSMSCNAIAADEENFACTFTTTHKKATDIQLKLQVNIHGDSFLEAGIDGTTPVPQDILEDVSKFMKTPAAKRYFNISSTSASKIKAKIPKREVVSRYFEDYIRHLILQIEPLINSMAAYQLKVN